MLAEGITLLILLISLALVLAYACIMSFRKPPILHIIHRVSSGGSSIENNEVLDYISAVDSQTALPLAWSFFASGMGSWVLFAFPEIGTFAGTWGLIGYTLSMCLPLGILAVVGPMLRQRIQGVAWSDYLAMRYGKLVQTYVSFISILYQFISLCAELTGIGMLVAEISPETSKLYPIIGVTVTTLTYTIAGGLRASIATDIWEGAGILTLVIVVCGVMLVTADISPTVWSSSNVLDFTNVGFEALVTLCIAVTSANLFLTGFWQRVWAAKNDHELRKASVLASLMTIPFAICLIGTGMLYVLVTKDESTSSSSTDDVNPFFYLLNRMGTGWQVLSVVIIVALVTSSVDTVQNGITTEIVGLIQSSSTLSSRFSPNLTHVRIVTVLVNIPAVLLSLLEINVLQLFLIVDLLTTVTVGPMLLSLWPKANATGALIGCASGILAVLVQGFWLHEGDVKRAIGHLLLPESIYATSTMVAFLLAMIVPVIVTIVYSIIKPNSERLRPSSILISSFYDSIQSPIK